MASVKKVSTGWRARWRTPDGRSRSQTFSRKVDAEQHLISIERSKLTAAYIDPAAGRVTFEDYVTRWMKSQVWRPSTQVRVEGVLQNHLIPRLGPRPLKSVGRSEVQALVRALSETLAPGTVNGIYTILVSVYRAAVRDRLLASVPWEGVKLPRQVARRVEPLTAEQIALLADDIGDRYRPLIIVGAGAGLRVGEALGLTSDKVDFLRRSLSVTQQAVTVKRITTLAPPKTPASTRTVPVGETVLADLAAWFERNPRSRGELLVGDLAGAPIPQNRFSQTWARTVERVGLPPGTRYHDLRHTFASALISAGCSVKAVQVALGHESATTTLNTYAHLWPSDSDRTRAAVDAFLTPDQEAKDEHAV